MGNRTCARCGSANVYHSYFEDHEERYLFLLKSPYRCKDCGLRVWAVGRKVRRLTISVVVLLILMVVSATIALLIPAEMPEAPKPAPQPALSYNANN